MKWIGNAAILHFQSERESRFEFAFYWISCQYPTYCSGKIKKKQFKVHASLFAFQKNIFLQITWRKTLRGNPTQEYMISWTGYRSISWNLDVNSFKYSITFFLVILELIVRGAVFREAYPKESINQLGRICIERNF